MHHYHHYLVHLQHQRQVHHHVSTSTHLLMFVILCLIGAALSVRIVVRDISFVLRVANATQNFKWYTKSLTRHSAMRHTRVKHNDNDGQ
jgi:hypothetical protein